MIPEKIAPKIRLYKGLCNVYYIADSTRVLIDAGADPGEEVDLIVLTNCEANAIAHAAELKDRWKCKIAASRGTAKFLEGKKVLHHGRTEIPSSRRVVGKHIRYLKVDRILEDGDVINTGMYKLKVLKARGHIVGDICLYDEEHRILFSNDVWYGDRMMGGPVHHGGKRKALELWITKLQKLKVSLLCPSHGNIRRL